MIKLIIRNSFSLFIVVTFSQQVLSQSYPFTLPDELSASINIDTTKQELYNNALLGTNIFHFSSQTEQALIDKFDPLTIRFPHGLWANWYDWEGDYTRLYGEEKVPFTNTSGGISNRTVDHLASIRIFESLRTKIGIDGLTDLNTQRKTQIESDYDMVWTFNMSADGADFDNGSPVSVARYQDLVARGFDVTNIELGNENFYPGQRSSIIPNTSDYLARAKSMSKALKALNPNIELSIPLLRRANTANPNWNDDLTQDKDYFDAVTVHTYVGANPDDTTTSDEAYATALEARLHIANSVDNYAKRVAPNKPIWLTEWGVKSGGPNAASILGMADAYIFMSENQDVYHRANWFSVNGKLNSFLVWEEYVSPSGVIRPRIKYPLEKTNFGASHEVIRSVLQDSVLLESETNTHLLRPGLKAISARSVIKNNKVVLFVLNMTDKTAPFNISLDGQEYQGAILHNTMSFDALDEERIIPIDQDPLSLINEGSQEVVLPKLSLNRIVLTDTNIEPNVFNVSLQAQSQQYSFEYGHSIKLLVDVESNQGEVSSLILSVGDVELANLTSPFYELEWRPTQLGVQKVEAVATLVNGDNVSTSKLFNISGEEVFEVSLATPSLLSIEIGQSLMLTGEAVTNLGAIASVNFRVDGVSIHQDNEYPYSFEWTSQTAGVFEIDIVATKVDGTNKATSAITIEVSAPPEVAPTPTPTLVSPPTEPNSSPSASNGGSLSIIILLVLGAISASRLTITRSSW